MSKRHREDEAVRLCKAAISGALGDVEELLACVDVRTARHMNRTALAWAARNGHTAVVHVLLRAGADVHACEPGGTPLIAASMGGHVDVVRALLLAGSDIHAYDCMGRTALRVAAAGGHVQVVCVLVGAGAHVGVRDRSGRTALDAASEFGHTGVIRELAGASTPPSLARALRAALRYERAEAAVLLIHNGARVVHMAVVPPQPSRRRERGRRRGVAAARLPWGVFGGGDAPEAVHAAMRRVEEAGRLERSADRRAALLQCLFAL